MRQSIKTTALLCFAAAVSMTVEASPLQALQAGPPQERQAQVQQEPTDSSVLYFTLDEAMSYALEHNWDLQNSSIAVRQAEADRWTAIASMLPQVNGTLDYSNYMGYEMAFGETGLSIAMPPYGSIGVNAALAVSGAQRSAGHQRPHRQDLRGDVRRHPPAVAAGGRRAGATPVFFRPGERPDTGTAGA